jgi:hypothetical protein
MSMHGRQDLPSSEIPSVVIQIFLQGTFVLESCVVKSALQLKQLNVPPVKEHV